MVETIGQSTSQFDLSRSTHHGGTDAITASSNGVHSMSGVDLNGSYSIPVGYFDHRFDTGHASSSTPATYMLTTQLGAGTFNGMGSYTSPQEPANGLPEPSPVIRDGLARDSGAGQVRQKRAYGKSCAACKRRKRKCPVRRQPLLVLTLLRADAPRYQGRDANGVSLCTYCTEAGIPCEYGVSRDVRRIHL